MEDRGDRAAQQSLQARLCHRPGCDHGSSAPPKKQLPVLIPRRVTERQDVVPILEHLKDIQGDGENDKNSDGRRHRECSATAEKHPATPIAKTGNVSTNPLWPKLAPNCQSHQLATT